VDWYILCGVIQATQEKIYRFKEYRRGVGVKHKWGVGNQGQHWNIGNKTIVRDTTYHGVGISFFSVVRVTILVHGYLQCNFGRIFVIQ
jgi:hypothetical protein